MADEWHEIQVVKNKDGRSEIIIENLENLNEDSTLVLRREGSKFKIGFKTQTL